MHLSLALLGPFQARLDGTVLAVSRAQKIEALLAYLAMEAERAHSRAFLNGLLFPETPELTARTNLRQTLARLRRAIQDEHADPPFLLLTPETVQFNPAGEYKLDVLDFRDRLRGCSLHRGRRDPACPECVQQLVEAVALYRGPFLEGLFVRGSEAFETWAQTVREYWHQEVMQACCLLTDYYERRGEYGTAIVYARRQVSLDSWCEEAHRQLMRLLARQGQRNAALAQYEQCRRILERELKVSPGQETRALHERIRTISENRLHNLPPLAARSFIGRERELGMLHQYLTDSERRLLTLTGPGGVGKTRLALQAGWAVVLDRLGPFMDGVFFVSLAAEGDAGGERGAVPLTMAIIEALALPLTDIRAPEKQLLEHLQSRECLLILDNGEYLDDSDRALIGQLLQKTSGVKILVAARARLRLIQEWVIDLAGLVYPESPVCQQQGDLPAAAGPEIELFPAVQLFIQRAGQIVSDFSFAALSLPDRAAVIRITQLTQGLPLALEMAAAWVRNLSCQQISREVQRNLDILAFNAFDLPVRHQCIQAVFEHSWKMLATEEQQGLGGLAVFQGSFTGEAAEWVVGVSRFTLFSLQDKSLLQRIEGEVLRYCMNPLLRRFVFGKVDPHRWEALGARHALYYGRFMEGWREDLKDARMPAAVQEIQADFENVRAGWRWAVANRQTDLLGQYLHPLYDFYALRFWRHEGREMFEAARASLAIEAGPGHVGAVYVGLLLRLVEFNYSLGDVDQAEELLQLSQSLKDQVECPAELAFAYEELGMAAHRRGDYLRADRLLELSLQLAQQSGHRSLIAHVLMSQGAVARDQEDYVRAQELFRESLMLYCVLEFSWGIAHASRLLGTVLHKLKMRTEARHHLEESLKLCQALGNGVAEALAWISLGQMAQTERQYDQAQEVYYRALALLQKVNDERGTALAVENLGDLALDQGQFQEALVCFRNSFEVAVKIQDVPMVLRILTRLARWAIRDGPQRLAREQILSYLGFDPVPADSAAFTERAWYCWNELSASFPPPAFVVLGQVA